MKKILGLAILITVLVFFLPLHSSGQQQELIVLTLKEIATIPSTNDRVHEFLVSKKSPLAPHTDFLLQHKHWKLLIAISAIESQYCTRKLGNNCWGIGGDSNYQRYVSIEEAITKADALITRWQAKGRWLTVEDMNCHYVVPCNPNWVSVVNKVINQLELYERPRRIRK